MKKIYSISAILLFLAGGLTAQKKSIQIPIPPDQNPQVATPIANIQAVASDDNAIITVTNNFIDPDDAEPAFTFAVLSNSVEAVATVSISDQDMHIDFLAEGQTTIILSATNDGLSVNDTFLIGVTPEITGTYETANFDDLSLDAESIWNGADQSASFISGLAKFPNTYTSSDFGDYWSGWAYSNTSDITTPGLSNYSAATGTGFNYGADNYGITTGFGGSQFTFNDLSAHEVKGFYVTNTTYAALSMKLGDDFAKKFGGADGSEADWFKLTITGKRDGQTTTSVDFMLADYTDADNNKDYLIETWQYVDLSDLGKIDTVMWSLSSSDNGDWGMNTPGYFCMDELLVLPDNGPTVANPLEDYSGEKNTQKVYDLSSVFDDSDDDNSNISLSLVADSWNASLITPVLNGTTLTIDLLEKGESDLKISAISNAKTVEELVTLSVLNTNISIDENASLNVYPNPSTGLFTIDMEGMQSADICVYDLSGRMVYTHKDLHSGTSIDLQNQKAGSYILTIVCGDEVSRTKIVKQ